MQKTLPSWMSTAVRVTAMPIRKVLFLVKCEMRVESLHVVITRPFSFLPFPDLCIKIATSLSLVPHWHPFSSHLVFV